MSKREKPLHKEVAEFVIHHLADRRAFAPFTGTDYDAWHAFIYLVRLYGRTRSGDVIIALRATLHTAQTRHEDVMAIFKKSIPCLLDWSDEPKIWLQIGPIQELSDVTRARVIAGMKKYGIAYSGEPLRVMWPCNDGPRVCHHEHSRPYKHDPDYLECRDCKAIWRPASAKEAT